MIELRAEFAEQMVSRLAALGDGDLAIADGEGNPVALSGAWSPGLVQRLSHAVKEFRQVCEMPLEGASAPDRQARTGDCLVGVPLVCGNQIVGTLIMRGERRRVRAATRYIEALAALLGRQLAAVDPEQQRDELRSGFVARLVQSDRATDLAALATEAQNAGIDLEIPRAALVVEIIQSSTTGDLAVADPPNRSSPTGRPNLIREMERACSPVEQAIVGQLRDGRIVVLHPVDPSLHEEQLEEVARRLLTIAESRGSRAHVGVGWYWPELEGLARSCREAVQALEAGSRLRVDGPIYTLTSVSVGVLLGGADVATRLALARRLLHGLDDDLIATVRAVLDADLSVSGAAHRLFLHRHTTLYRLDKVRQRTGRDARRFWDVLPLALALTILRLTDGDTSSE